MHSDIVSKLFAIATFGRGANSFVRAHLLDLLVCPRHQKYSVEIVTLIRNTLGQRRNINRIHFGGMGHRTFRSLSMFANSSFRG